jgi:CRISPR/Cas system-associated endonuclease Cas1
VTQIFLTSEQVRQFADAQDGVVFCDDSGNAIVRVPPTIGADETAILAEAKRRLASDQPRRASAEVLARLGSRA